MDLMLCAYYLHYGKDPEHILELTTREKMFYLASMSWWSDKMKPKGNTQNGNI